MHTPAGLHLIFEKELSRLKFESEPKNLYEPFPYIFSKGGKRMRPVMLLMACEMFSDQIEPAIPQAIAIELFHNFSLIHDDIMDRAPIRRGAASVHEKFGEPTAILSGDVMLVHAYHYLIQSESRLIPLLLSVFNECAIKVCQGQQLDMNFETTHEIDTEEYLEMIGQKTATLFATSLKLGSMIGNASDKDADHLYQFGKEMGIAFQLKDDWLDAFGSTDKVGKKRGGDIIQNKKTFLFVEAFSKSDGKLRKEIQRLYAMSPSDSEEKIKKVTEMFETLGISSTTKAEIHKHYAKAMDHLSRVSLSDQRKESLIALSEMILNREY